MKHLKEVGHLNIVSILQIKDGLIRALDVVFNKTRHLFKKQVAVMIIVCKFSFIIHYILLSV